MSMEVEIGMPSIQVVSFKLTLHQDNYIVPDYALQLLRFAMFNGFSQCGTSFITLQTLHSVAELSSSCTTTYQVAKQVIFSILMKSLKIPPPSHSCGATILNKIYPWQQTTQQFSSLSLSCCCGATFMAIPTMVTKLVFYSSTNDSKARAKPIC
eukprot:13142836-Ditylum_brightwellii.AAC.2